LLFSQILSESDVFKLTVSDTVFTTNPLGKVDLEFGCFTHGAKLLYGLLPKFAGKAHCQANVIYRFAMNACK